MAPPGMSVQFQHVMQPQVVEDQSHQSNFHAQIQHINPPNNQSLSQPIQQQINENQQKLNGMPPFNASNVPQAVPYPQQVCQR